jgi:hypothetical protein
MAVYIVMEPPGGVGADAAADARLVRDGFSWPAFLVPPLWLLWHRLWLEALLAFAAMAALEALGEVSGHRAAGFAMGLLVSFFVGLEGQGMRLAALFRGGWREWGAVEAGSRDDAETRYALEASGADAAEPIRHAIVPDRAQARPVQTGLALGLSHNPGKP